MIQRIKLLFKNTTEIIVVYVVIIYYMKAVTSNLISVCCLSTGC